MRQQQHDRRLESSALGLEPLKYDAIVRRNERAMSASCDEEYITVWLVPWRPSPVLVEYWKREDRQRLLC